MVQTTTSCDSLSLNSPVYLSTHTFFLPNEHFTYFTTFCVNEEIHFCTADRPGPRHWPLIPSGLLIRIQSSPCHGVTSLSGQESKPCFKPLLAKVIQNQDSIGKGFSPARLPLPPTTLPTLHFRHQLKIQVDTCPSGWWTKSEAPTNPFVGFN